MANFIKYIGLLVLTLAFWQNGSSDLFVGQTIDEVQPAVSENAIYHPQEVTYFSLPQLPYLPDAELAGASAQSQLLTFLRVQRTPFTEGIFSMKGWIDMLAQREAALSLNREKLYDATAYYCFHPVCDYYVFTLRRILI